jgi:hypothetical protein
VPSPSYLPVTTAILCEVIAHSYVLLSFQSVGAVYFLFLSNTVPSHSIEFLIFRRDCLLCLMLLSWPKFHSCVLEQNRLIFGQLMLLLSKSWSDNKKCKHSLSVLPFNLIPVTFPLKLSLLISSP